MKFKIKDEDLAIRNLEEAVRRLPLKMRLAGATASDILKILNPAEILEVLSPEERLEGLKPEDRLKGLKSDELKRMKEMLDKLNIN